MLFPNQLRALRPHAHVLIGLYCYSTAEYVEAESHFAEAVTGLSQDLGSQGPRAIASALMACALLAQVCEQGCDARIEALVCLYETPPDRRLSHTCRTVLIV